MKTNKKTIISAVALVLSFSLLLSVCMVMLSCRKEPQKPVDDDTSIIQGEAPQPQEKLKEKFASFSTQTEKNGEKTLDVFSDEQFEASLARIKNGERFYLTQEEMLFIIDDSVRMYMENDRVLLNGWDKLPCVEMLVSEKQKTEAETETAAEDFDIECYHGDFTEFLYKDAVVKYQEMLTDIFHIIIYRFALHDSRFFTAFEAEVRYSGLSGGANIFCFGGEDEVQPGYNALYTVMADEGALESTEDYKNAIKKVFNYSIPDCSPDRVEEEIGDFLCKYPIFTFSLESKGKIPMAFVSDNVVEDEGIKLWRGRFDSETVFPTKELKAKRPAMKLDESCFELSDTYQLTMKLPNGSTYFSMADGASLRKAAQLDNLESDNIKAIINNTEFAGTVTNDDDSFVLGTPDKVLYGVNIGFDTTIYSGYDGLGYILQSHGNKTALYKLKSPMPEEYTDMLQSIFTSQLAYAYLKTDNYFTHYDQGYLSSSVTMAGIKPNMAVFYDPDRVQELDGTDYDEFAEKYGKGYVPISPISSIHDLTIFYYTENGLYYTFRMDNGKISDGKYEDAYHFRQFVVTDVKDGLVYADGGYGKEYTIDISDYEGDVPTVGDAGVMSFIYTVEEANSAGDIHSMPKKLSVKPVDMALMVRL